MFQKGRDFAHGWRSARLIRSLSPVIPELIEQCPDLVRMAPADQWSIEEIFPTLSDMNVITLASKGDTSSAILYLPKTNRAIADFERRKKVIAELLQDTRLSDLWKYLPRLLGEGVYQQHPYWITTRLPGVSSEIALRGDKMASVIRLAIQALGILHHKTANLVQVGDDLLDRWVFAPIRIILQSPLVYYHRASHSLLERLGATVAKSLTGKRLALSWVHGDFWPNNVLLSTDFKQITGIVDWDLAQPDDLPLMDVTNFLLSSCSAVSREELGQLIVTTHKLGRWEGAMQDIWEVEARALDNAAPGLRDSLLIFWIRHLSANLRKSRRYSVNPVWAIKNYQFMMKYLETGMLS